MPNLPLKFSWLVVKPSEARRAGEPHLATEVALAPPREFRQGSVGAAPSGVQGQRPAPAGGLGGGAPGKFLNNLGILEQF